MSPQCASLLDGSDTLKGREMGRLLDDNANCFSSLSAEGPIDINMSEIRMDDIHELFSRDPTIKLGGHWKPADCVPRWKVGYESDPAAGNLSGIARVQEP